MKKIQLPLIIILSLFIIPSIAMASWWNPFSWKIFQKKATAPQVQVEIQKTPEEKINDLQKQLDDLKKQQPVSNSTTIIPKTKEQAVPVSTTKTVKPTQTIKTEEVKAENFNYLVVQLTDSLTSSFEQSLKDNTEFKNILQSRRQESLRLQSEFQSHVVDSVPQGVNIPNDLYRAIVKGYTTNIALSGVWINLQDVVINNINKVISQNRNYKIDVLSSSYSKEQAIVSMKEMMKEYDTLDLISQTRDKNYSQYLASSQSFDDLITQATNALKKNADENAYQASLPTGFNQPVQQMVFPKIEFPKTTYCHIGYTGVYGNYDVTCN